MSKVTGNPEYRFEVALSFAGDNKRGRVRRIAEALEDRLGKGKVFFDEWYEAELAGQDAARLLQTIYGVRSRLVVSCVCQRYNEKAWTQDEWRAIQALERENRDAGTDNVKRMRFLPLRFGDGEIDGIFSTAIVPDAREKSDDEVVELILERLKLSKGHRIENEDNDEPTDEILGASSSAKIESRDEAEFGTPILKAKKKKIEENLKELRNEFRKILAYSKLTSDALIDSLELPPATSTEELAEKLTTFPNSAEAPGDRFNETDPIEDLEICYEATVFPKTPKTVEEKERLVEILSNLIELGNLILVFQFREADLQKLVEMISEGLKSRKPTLANVQTRNSRVSFTMAAGAIGIRPPNEIKTLLKGSDPIDSVGNSITPFGFPPECGENIEKFVDDCFRDLGRIFFLHECESIEMLNELISRRKRRKHYVVCFLPPQIDLDTAKLLAERFDSIIFLHSRGNEDHDEIVRLCYPIESMIGNLKRLEGIVIEKNDS